MALRLLAQPQDLASHLGAAQVSEEKVLAALAAASALVRSHTRRPDGWATGDIPDPVFQAVLFIARRVALMPEASTGDETVGPFTVKRDSAMWLSATEKILLSGYTSSGVTSMGLTGPTGRWPEGDIFVPGDLPFSDPIIFSEGDV